MLASTLSDMRLAGRSGEMISGTSSPYRVEYIRVGKIFSYTERAQSAIMKFTFSCAVAHEDVTILALSHCN
jgi:hypothetical protein